MVHFIVSICWSFMDGVLQAQSRWSAQYNIPTVSSEGRAHAFRHLSHSHVVSFVRLSESFLPLHLPVLYFLTLFPPPAHLNPYHPLTVILQYSFLPFMSVSSHFAPGRQWIKSSDRQVLVLLLVLSETARCRAPVSVWCSLHQHAAARVQNRGEKKKKKTDRYFLWAHLLTPLPNSRFYGCVTLMCKSDMCERMTEYVYVGLCISVCV